MLLPHGYVIGEQQRETKQRYYEVAIILEQPNQPLHRGWLNNHAFRPANDDCQTVRGRQGVIRTEMNGARLVHKATVVLLAGSRTTGITLNESQRCLLAEVQ